MSLITQNQVVLDLQATERTDAIRELAATLAADGRVSDTEAFVADVLARETQMATGLPGGIGIPHARSAAVTQPSLVFARSANGVDWGAEDGPADIIFMIAAPDGGGEEHLAILAKLARKLMRASFKDALRAAQTPAEVVEIVEREVVNA
ncbi:PTS sugar transporter subunit IIA [Dermacoccus nishinomiyaensis]|uniref:PTS sugar transporter subunit IIA n=1 Tax=Dermacoccus nishinomiyaensis TaxID=1274 RepID=UPI0021A8F579|nr:fructose PTS transporter subunit IIA [Dermacoccus nishinomiyaensis]MCT1604682.1 fructose PTS transporter subunit IIA [Dermacoccus nishinomiyaensis]